MAKGNLQRCLDVVFPFEGGYVDHPRDPGGATNMGITFDVLRKWRGKPITKQDVRDLTKAEAEQIYARNYARPLHFDDLPIGIDLTTLDFGINSGVSRSARYLQAVVSAKQDGVIGEADTLPKVKTANPRDVIKKLCARRLSFVQSLKIWDTFGKGWSRRIAHMEATALSWVSSKSQLEADAKDARNKSAGQGTVAVGTGAGGVGIDQAAGAPVGILLVVVAVVAGVFIVRAVINGQRAKALAEAAANQA
ncbi:Lysozyme family protein [Devosia lucknowensis]|uniref:Lysozyme family protein n=1 Tax=Devosia lucknowensis TaxID=1096929 RepID=A0A1Y6EU30_9HYPH|nr:glycosyl hydrolase 108 family protein [Devosia lucknowensis]SMQ65806.1 Lysozyme family protein [Devosia lucknowensis]